MRALLCLLVACAHPRAAGIERDLDIEAPAVVADAAVAAPMSTITLTATSPVRAEPTAGSARIGIIGKGARAKVVQIKPPADSCALRWIEISPRGWVCESNVVATAEPADAPRVAALDDTSDPELGTYGAVRGVLYDNRDDVVADGGHPADGSMIVRSTGVTVIGDRRYVVASDGSLLDEGAFAAMSPSSFRGVALTDGRLEVAWTHRAGAPRREVPVRAKPSAGAPITGNLPPRSEVTVVETSRDGRFVRVNDVDWVARADLRIPSRAAPPGNVGATDRWFDIDLDEQTLVAYEGTTPVYATLVSTGRPAHRTEARLARVQLKLRMTTMTNAGDDAYSVADVPWAMYYDDTLALHGAYWHDSFGDVKSHGCVNLAPRDARVLYDWSSPDVPPGWTAVYANPELPGSVIRLRTHAR